jgi:uracil-DNA glycosylase
MMPGPFDEGAIPEHRRQSGQSIWGSVPGDWLEALRSPHRSFNVTTLERFVADERTRYEVYPSSGLEFEALRLTPFQSVKAVILGQDPYHGAGQAHGLAFSTLVRKKPPSLRNILQEWHDDCHFGIPEDGSLVAWAEHGVLLLNTALTVRDGDPNSHAAEWQPFTSAIIQAVATRPDRVAFLLWGAQAIRVGSLVDQSRHTVVESSHPSSRSFRRPCGNAPAFAGSHPFTRANEGLASAINWSLRR